MRREPPLDFIFMLTRHDRTVEDAGELIDAACDLGVTHVGFKDVGVPPAVMQELVRKIRSARSSLLPRSREHDTRGRAPVAPRWRAISGSTACWAGPISTRRSESSATFPATFPFPGRPIGHPTRLEGSAALVAEHSPQGAGDGLRRRRSPCVPRDRGRSARSGARRARGIAGGKLIVAGSISTKRQIDALAEAGVDAFTIGSAVFEGAFSPGEGIAAGADRGHSRGLRQRLEDVGVSGGDTWIALR